MLIPRYSLRWLLGLTTCCAGISLVLSHAVRGRPWAIGVTSGLWSLVIVGLFYIGAFLVAWLIAHVTTSGCPGRERGAGDSPFAVAKPAEYPVVGPGVVQSQPAADTPPSMTG
jgi:hypothetical protein